MTLDPGTRALVRLAALMNDATSEQLVACMSEARAAGAEPAWVEELVLAGVLFLGFPRALVAAAARRQVFPESPPDPGDASDYDRWQDWARRGQEACRVIYGVNYDKLRANLADLHPALEAWVVVDGYGRTLSRPALDVRRRELCAIAALVPQGVPRQLHSHLVGALNAGASRADVAAVLDAVADVSCVNAERLAAARAQWQELR